MDNTKKYTGKIIWRIALVVLLYSALTHWKDLKNGIADGWNKGLAVTTSK